MMMNIFILNQHHASVRIFTTGTTFVHSSLLNVMSLANSPSCDHYITAMIVT